MSYITDLAKSFIKVKRKSKNIKERPKFTPMDGNEGKIITNDGEGFIFANRTFNKDKSSYFIFPRGSL